MDILAAAFRSAHMNYMRGSLEQQNNGSRQAFFNLLKVFRATFHLPYNIIDME